MTSHRRDTLVDDDKVARDAAEFSRRLAILDRAHAVEQIHADERRATAQEKFDAIGLPRGTYVEGL